MICDNDRAFLILASDHALRKVCRQHNIMDRQDSHQWPVHKKRGCVVKIALVQATMSQGLYPMPQIAHKTSLATVRELLLRALTE